MVRDAVEQEVLLGMSTGEALRSATSTGAVVCELGDRKGGIAEGYDADILAIDGDPLTDPSTQAAPVRRLRLRSTVPGGSRAVAAARDWGVLCLWWVPSVWWTLGVQKGVERC